MQKVILPVIFGVVVVAAFFFLIITSNENIIEQEIESGEKFTTTSEYSNPFDFKTEIYYEVNLNVPSEFSLIEYKQKGIFLPDGSFTGNPDIRLFKTNYSVEFEGVSGKEKLSGDDLSGIEFSAITGTQVLYSFFHEVLLYENETVKFDYIFDTSFAQPGLYDISKNIDGNSTSYRIQVKPSLEN